jgi:hypothetical protein
MSPKKVNDQWTEYRVPFVREDPDIPFLYHVESLSGDGEHVVDLTDRGGLGACSCKDFAARANFNFKKLLSWIPYGPKREGRSDCVHLEAAKVHMYMYVTVPMLKRFASGIVKK